VRPMEGEKGEVALWREVGDHLHGAKKGTMPSGPWPGGRQRPSANRGNEAGSPMGASSRGRGPNLPDRCPLCGAYVPRCNREYHTYKHLSKLERKGVLTISREQGAWVMHVGERKIFGIGWLSLAAVADALHDSRRGDPETRRGGWVKCRKGESVGGR